MNHFFLSAQSDVKHKIYSFLGGPLNCSRLWTINIFLYYYYSSNTIIEPYESVVIKNGGLNFITEDPNEQYAEVLEDDDELMDEIDPYGYTR